MYIFNIIHIYFIQLCVVLCAFNSLTCLSLNVRGLVTNPEKLMRVYPELKKCGVAFLQETKLQNAAQAHKLNQLLERDFEIFHSYATDRGNGITTLVKKGFCKPNVRRIFQRQGQNHWFTIRV